MKTRIELGDLKVGSIDTSSGIFIAKSNIGNNWKSQTKNNTGFGNIGDRNTIKNCFVSVIDDDVMDAPMVNANVSIDQHLHAPNKDTSIQFNDLKVEALNQNATISIGETAQAGWTSQSKSNEGNGEFYGDSELIQNKTYIKDDDAIDAPVFENYKVISRTNS